MATYVAPCVQDFPIIQHYYSEWFIGYDKDENPVFLAASPFLLTQAEGDYPSIKFHKTSEFKLDEI